MVLQHLVPKYVRFLDKLALSFSTAESGIRSWRVPRGENGKRTVPPSFPRFLAGGEAVPDRPGGGDVDPESAPDTFPEAEFDAELLASAPAVIPAPASPAASPLEGDLALCLSGGGYRAAAYHLGVLDMLHRLKLLDRLATLSTISGGTITGAAYALSCAKGTEPFETFFDRHYKALLRHNVVAEAFAGLGSSRRKEASPSLIRAAADVYANDDFVGDARFSTLMDTTRGPDELIFSATEFRTGLAFRFQTSRRSGVFIGNQPPLRIPDATARSMRVADVVAASSCFPGAFEPLRFPHDFNWGGPAPDDLGDGFAEPLPLMDGGVYDNQGVDGVTQVYRREGREVGLVMVSDTSLRENPLFRSPVTPRRGGLSVKWAVRIAIGLFAASVISAVLLTLELLEAGRAGLETNDVFRLGVPLLLTAAVAISLAWLRATFTRELRRLRADTEVKLWPVLRELAVADVLHLVESRARSLVALTSSVFMKRVRGLIQRSLFIDERYKGRVLFNLIYDLDRDRHNLYENVPDLRPSPELVALAKRAESVPTTLWFTDERDLRSLVAAGQATTCFTLLEYLYETFSPDLEKPASPARILHDAVKPFWDQLQESPTNLLEPQNADG